MTRTSQLLCVFYALVAITALYGTMSENLQYASTFPQFLTQFPSILPQFLTDMKANPASRSISIDISLFLLAAAALMVREARRVGGGLTAARNGTKDLRVLLKGLLGRHSTARGLRVNGYLNSSQSAPRCQYTAILVMMLPISLQSKRIASTALPPFSIAAWRRRSIACSRLSESN